MVDPASGPFLFDASAESWLERDSRPGARPWLDSYLSQHAICVSAVTVLERVRGYALLWHRAKPAARPNIEAAQRAYFAMPVVVLPMDQTVAIVAGEIMALRPDPPSAPRRSHGWAESRRDRPARWRFDAMVAATALVAGMTLLHNNARDFEAIRDAVEIHPERFPGMGPLRLIHCPWLL